MVADLLREHAWALVSLFGGLVCRCKPGKGGGRWRLGLPFHFHFHGALMGNSVEQFCFLEGFFGSL